MADLSRFFAAAATSGTENAPSAVLDGFSPSIVGASITPPLLTPSQIQGSQAPVLLNPLSLLAIPAADNSQAALGDQLATGKGATQWQTCHDFLPPLPRAEQKMHHLPFWMDFLHPLLELRSLHRC
mmetsp:Transcript_65201/g.175027  ORF Transcript_65201/g.175027 Transcript_65201/m.175027 type:complete len:126 (+) Transcript_65201:49-426(+)